jgi:hypothetical protein
MSSAMKGAVFQTSARMITIRACGSDPSQTVCVPRSVFTKPYGDTNIVRHMTAVTTVSTAHGTSTVVRRSPWPRKAACIASAMPRPISSSSVTDDTVKMSVCLSAAHHSEDCRAVW